jgi:predicted Zn finger-like uncharacterized protein
VKVNPLTNKTQCPECFAVFMVAGEQLLRSNGKVRCGRCRNAFNATLLSIEEEAELEMHNHGRSEPVQTRKRHEEGNNKNFSQIVSRSDVTKSVIPQVNVNRAKPHDEEPSAYDKTPSESDHDSFPITHYRGEYVLTDALSVIDHTPSFNIEDYRESNMGNAESTDDPKQDNIASEDLVNTNYDPRLADTLAAIKLAKAGRSDVNTSYASQFSEAASDQIDKLDGPGEEQRRTAGADPRIEDMLVIDSIDADEDYLIDFGKTTKHRALSHRTYSPLLGLMALLLTAALSYQLWLKQAAPMLESTQLATALQPIKQQLQKYAVVLPERRNLKHLELLSARTEAHPTRSSTVLLRTSLVNKAKISQPFPWLELSLTDKDGRLVSRRALSPNDYLHNNRLENLIKANELKPVTIELLTFPKQAHGFELRLLNK